MNLDLSIVVDTADQVHYLIDAVLLAGHNNIITAMNQDKDTAVMFTDLKIDVI